MKVFVINLDKNIERIDWIREQLDALGIEFERYPAILGAALPKDEYSRCTNSFRSLMAHGAKLEMGEVGCALSHMAIYRKIIEENLPYALILEDDCTFEKRFSGVLKNVESFVCAEKKEIVLLSAHGVPSEERQIDRGIIPIMGGSCTDAYVITNAAAQAILHANFPVVVPCDSWPRFRRFFGVKMFRATPCTVWQDTRFITEIKKNHVPYRGYPKMVWKVFRLLGMLVDCMAIFVSRCFGGVH